MGTVLEKANKIKETKNKLKEAINDGGGQITNDTVFNNYVNEIKDIYIDAINNGVDNLYNNFPKITGEGSEITLDTEEAPMKITLEGNTSQKTSILPEGYTQVDYIESSGTQYLDTGLILTQDNSVELEISINTKNNQGKMIFGSRTDANDNNFSINSFNKISIDFNNSDYSTYRVEWDYTIDTKYILYNSKEKRIVYDENKNILIQNTTVCNDTITTSNTATLFYINPKPSNTWYNISAKIYYCKIWDNNVLVREIIPCYRNSDNVVGMYDLITDTFYTNQGTGVFTYGSVTQIPNPDYPQDIKVVTGEQNIKIINKNLFNYENFSKTYSRVTIENENNLFSINATTGSTYYPQITLKKDTIQTNSYWQNSISTNEPLFKFNNLTKKHIISLKNVNFDERLVSSIRIYYQNNNYLTLWAGNNSAEIPEGYNILAIGFLFSPNKTYIGSLNFQIENDEETEYEQHQEIDYPLSLSNIELARIGNYKDYIFKNEIGSPYYNADLDLNEWYLHKEIIGENLWEKAWVYENEYSTPVPRTVLRLRNMSTIHVYFSNCFLSSEMNNQQIVNRLKTDSPNWFLASANNLTGIEITDSNNIKVNKMIAFLQSISANIYYRLATPTNTKITDTTLIAQLEDLDNAHSYSGTTIIECSSVDNTNEVIQTSTIALKNIDLIESEWSL